MASFSAHFCSYCFTPIREGGLEGEEPIPSFRIRLDAAVEGETGVLNRRCPFLDLIVDPEPFAVLQLLHGLFKPHHLVLTVRPAGVTEPADCPDGTGTARSTGHATES